MKIDYTKLINSLANTNNNDINQVQQPQKEEETSLLKSSDAVDTVQINSKNATVSNNESYIKEILYKIHHPAQDFIASEQLGDAYDILKYAHQQDSSININTGITRGQLLSLTQQDRWEESNQHFFGKINSVFDKIDKDSNGTLSYDELREFSGWQFGTTNTQFNTKVNNWANEIENEYERLNNQGKLEFAIEKTEEYLQAAGLDKQYKALQRLKNSDEDIYNKNNPHVGQIAFADLSENATSGAYSAGAYASYSYSNESAAYEDMSYKNYAIALYASDADDEYNDLGITLDKAYYLDGIFGKIPWYQLVSVLVHELTHATASLWVGTNVPNAQTYGDFAPPCDIGQLTKMYEIGALSETEYLYCKRNLSSIKYGSELFNKLAYISTCMWGEYYAYQTNEDFLDSIAHGDYSGANEKSSIENHISQLYDAGKTDYLEAKPEWTWWTYS